MKVQATINQDHNNLLIQLDGNQTYLGIMTGEGDILRISRSPGVKSFSFDALPGKYQLESDGEIISAESRLLEEKQSVNVTLLAYQPKSDPVMIIALDEVWQEETIDELMNQKRLTLKDLKAAMVIYFNQQASAMRKNIISDEQLIYANLGVYSTTVKSRYQRTVLAFEQERIRLVRIIQGARSLKKLKTLTINFPDKIILKTIDKKTLPKKVAKKSPTKNKS